MSSSVDLLISNWLRINLEQSYTVCGSIFIKPGCFYQNLVDVKLMQSLAWGSLRLVKLHLMFGGGKYRYVVLVLELVEAGAGGISISQCTVLLHSKDKLITQPHHHSNPPALSNSISSDDRAIFGIIRPSLHKLFIVLLFPVCVSPKLQTINLAK